MHSKLEKFVSACRDKSNDASLQSEKARSLEQELNESRQERDEMAAELERLRTEAALFEQERQEHRRVKSALMEYESRGLDQAEAAIASRDEMITKLSSRLETALGTLQWERQQQRQRRQIIFPPKGVPTAVEAIASEEATSHNNLNINHSNGGIDHSYSANHHDRTNSEHSITKDDEVVRLRAELLESQKRLETMQLQGRQRELAMMLQRDTIEKKNSTQPFRKAKSSIDDGC